VSRLEAKCRSLDGFCKICLLLLETKHPLFLYGNALVCDSPNVAFTDHSPPNSLTGVSSCSLVSNLVPLSILHKAPHGTATLLRTAATVGFLCWPPTSPVPSEPVIHSASRPAIAPNALSWLVRSCPLPGLCQGYDIPWPVRQ
jgi:hypothetical protein